MPRIIEPEGPPEDGAPPTSLWGRLAWFFGLALVSALTVAAVAYLLRSLIL